MKIEWEHGSTSSGTYTTQDRSYIGIHDTRADINRNTIENVSGEPEKSILNSNTSFVTRTDTLDVSGISGDRYIGVGIQLSSNWEQFVELDVFDIWGVDSAGNRVFEVNIPGN